MLRRIFFISSVHRMACAITLLFLTAPRLALADVSEQLKQAQTHQSKGQYEQAEASYQRIVTAFPDTNEALEAQKQLAIIYIATDKQQKADAAFKKLVADFPKHKDIAKAVYQIARKCYELKKYENAEPLYKRVLDTWPEDTYAMWSQAELAKINIMRGNEAATDAVVEKLFAAASGHKDAAEVVYYVARKYYDLKKYEKAEPLYKRVLDTWPDDTYAMWSQTDIVKFNILLGNEAAADAAIEKLLATFSGQKDTAKAVYQIAHKLKNDQKALVLYQYIIQNHPEDTYAVWSQADIAKLNILVGNEPVADTAIEKLLATFSGHKDLPKALYQIARKLKDDQKALVLYQYIIQNHPDDEHAILSRARIGCICIRQGDNNTAQTVLNQLLSDFPGHPILPRAVGVMADGYFEQALLLESQGLDEQAKWYYQKAITECQRILNQLPETPYITAEACYFLGVCYERLGQFEKAIEFYQKVVDKWPDFKYAWNALFLVGLNYEKLKNSGLIPPSEADAKTKIAYERLLKDYTTCTVANIARQWLSRQAETK